MVYILFSHFLTAQESYVSRLGRVIILLPAILHQSGNHCSTIKPRSGSKMQVWDVGSLGAAAPTRTGRLVWDIYNEGENNFLNVSYIYLTN